MKNPKVKIQKMEALINKMKAAGPTLFAEDISEMEDEIDALQQEHNFEIQVECNEKLHKDVNSFIHFFNENTFLDNLELIQEISKDITEAYESKII